MGPGASGSAFMLMLPYQVDAGSADVAEADLGLAAEVR
jgi:hypothetical protein